MRYTKVPESLFDEIQMNAGILLSKFTPDTGAFDAADQIGATTGGVTFAVTHTYTDLGDDVDNCPKNMMELKRLDGTEVKLSGTFITANTRTAKMLAAAADIDTKDTSKIVPRTALKDTDFTDLWLVGDYGSNNGETTGGRIAIHVLNALSTGGFSLKTSDEAKGQFAFEFTGHTSIESQDVVPYEIYIAAGSGE